MSVVWLDGFWMGPIWVWYGFSGCARRVNVAKCRQHKKKQLILRVYEWITEPQCCPEWGRSCGPHAAVWPPHCVVLRGVTTFLLFHLVFSSLGTIALRLPNSESSIDNKMKCLSLHTFFCIFFLSYSSSSLSYLQLISLFTYLFLVDGVLHYLWGFPKMHYGCLFTLFHILLHHLCLGINDFYFNPSHSFSSFSLF